jgi:hypothetical protein
VGGVDWAAASEAKPRREAATTKDFIFSVIGESVGEEGVLGARGSAVDLARPSKEKRYSQKIG